MTTDRGTEYLAGLVRELCKLPHETEWVEFKVNNSDPQDIGEYLSALANAAALNGNKLFGLPAVKNIHSFSPTEHKLFSERAIGSQPPLSGS